MSAERRLSLNTMTTKRLTLREAVEAAAAVGLEAIGPWRDRVAEAGLDIASKLVHDNGLRVSSLCRGGFLTGYDEDAALVDNRRAIEEAATLGTRELVLVVGGVPDRDLAAARQRVVQRLEKLVPYAVDHGVRLALEPLHPVFCADRAVISTIGQALALAAPYPAEAVGVVVDTFHVWWDPQLAEGIAAAGEQDRISSYQVCDWLVPMAADPLVSRGMMGDGVIDFGAIMAMVRAAGYDGDVEVEIFNEEVWATDPDVVIDTMKQRYRDLVAPSLTAG
ncbi:sugar phosphate isomerase/epimerase family protein [Mycolicibacterium goodii]|uniref:sugar phosphate isomerase/epimerase family protein n=1 Tax=Mycolicibacterium goodii TaxID=134601 RepID=UPI001BDCC905|nr:sugar phosphate isomerase/epimerase family protein [Mycolicibacterium goodii]MBU8832961.1 sugar phosphate isomerase/epimerase [Mycolicibacterium goodii]